MNESNKTQTVFFKFLKAAINHVSFSFVWLFIFSKFQTFIGFNFVSTIYNLPNHYWQSLPWYKIIIMCEFLLVRF